MYFWRFYTVNLRTLHSQQKIQNISLCLSLIKAFRHTTEHFVNANIIKKVHTQTIKSQAQDSFLQVARLINNFAFFYSRRASSAVTCIRLNLPDARSFFRSYFSDWSEKTQKILFLFSVTVLVYTLKKI